MVKYPIPLGHPEPIKNIGQEHRFHGRRLSLSYYILKDKSPF